MGSFQAPKVLGKEETRKLEKRGLQRSGSIGKNNGQKTPPPKDIPKGLVKIHFLQFHLRGI
jgi:hypothetical protein